MGKKDYILPIIFIICTIITGIAIDAKTNGYKKLFPSERPIVNIPYCMRQSNWIFKNGEASCAWASTISLLRWQGENELADNVVRKYGGGEYVEEFGKHLSEAGVRFAATDSGDESFLEWACNTRRGAAVGVMPSRKVKNNPLHMVSLVHFEKERVCVLDNNDISKFIWISRKEFADEWKQAGGFAFVPIYNPPAPLP